MCVFAAIAGALTLMIPAGMEHSHFMRRHPYIEDFYTEEQKAQARSSFTAQLIGGIITIFFGICLLMLLDGSSGIESLRPRSLLVLSMNGEVLGTVAMLICIAVGAFFIVHGSMMLARTNLANYNMAAAEVLEAHEIAQAPLSPEKKEEMLKTKSIDRKIGALCGTAVLAGVAYRRHLVRHRVDADEGVQYLRVGWRQEPKAGDGRGTGGEAMI